MGQINGYHLLQTNTSKQPEVVDSALDASHKSLDFNSSSAIIRDHGSNFWDRNNYDIFVSQSRSTPNLTINGSKPMS